MIDRFQIVVSNIGTVHSGMNRLDAEREYKECCEMVDKHYGRASGETVTFIMDGEIQYEHEPKKGGTDEKDHDLL